MPNNADLGLTIQKETCELYHLTPCEYASKQFDANFNPDFANRIRDYISDVFNQINATPTKCLTYTSSENAKESLSPHNFLLSNDATLSIRTNKKGAKVAPRVVGQCGIDRFNEHFSDIAGYEITNKSQIKRVIWDNIHLMLPVFLDYLLMSDYTVWFYGNGEEWEYEIINKDSYVDMETERSNYSFTKDLNAWNESTTLKYKGISIAEIQIHKNRTFKLRFIMNKLLQFLTEQKKTTETLGMTAEKAVCELFNLDYPTSFKRRTSFNLQLNINDSITAAFEHLPPATKHTGSMQGTRGGDSKCSYDFVLEGDKTLSLKTNTGKMVCPPEVGQPCAETCYLYFGDLTSASEINEDVFKAMVFEHIEEMIKIYAAHLFDSDYLLWIYKENDNYDYKIFNRGFADDYYWEKDCFSFTKKTIADWNESNTVKYNGTTIGEFQVHKHRDCFKFRFNLANLERLISVKTSDQ